MKSILLLALLTCFEDIRVNVTSKDGKTQRGTVAISSIAMTTSFGEVMLDVRQIDSIQFGDPDSVTTRDQTKLKGRLKLDELSVKADGGTVTLTRGQLVSLTADLGAAEFLPGKIVDGAAANRMTYHVRLPAGYDADRGAPALVLLHGSNMNSKAYVNTVVAAWPKLADEYVLIGINGEFRVQNSPAENPAFNYSGVNFVGRSKFKGYQGTDRESPALIPEVIAELKERLKLGRLFVGGHSQGGFVTYSVMMNYPELIAGAFPISAGPWIQCEPNAYDNAEIRAAQRRVPLAVIHGENDPVVAFTQGKAAFDSFDDDGFPMLHLFSDKSAGHMFARLPVEAAIRWLEQMSSDDAASLLKFAGDRAATGDYRDATAAIARAKSIDAAGEFREGLDAIDAKIAAAAAPLAKKLEPAIASAKDDSWVKDLMQFRTQFQFAAGATGVMDAYRKLRAKHEEPATKLWNEARADFQTGKQDSGYEKYGEIVKKYFASSWYRYAKPAIEQRPGANTKK